jgi:hypothetical protein
MSKKKMFGIACLLLAGVGVAIGVFVWRAGGPDGPGRKLVGVWEVEEPGRDVEKAVKEELEKKDPRLPDAVGDEFRSTERIRFNANGECRHVENLLGMTLTSEGNWQATGKEENKLLVKFHWTKLSLRNKGETREEAKDAVVEWVVTLVGPDRLSVVMTTDDGDSQRFDLRRTRD